MSAASEIAQVAVPVAIGVVAVLAYLVIRWKAVKLRARHDAFRGLAGGDFGPISGDYGPGHHCDHGGHGHHGGDHGGGDGGGGHGGGDGGGGGHH